MTVDALASQLWVVGLDVLLPGMMANWHGSTGLAGKQPDLADLSSAQ